MYNGILNYRDDYVVSVLSEKLAISPRKALFLFKDVLKFLFLTSEAEGLPLAPSRKIDAGLHEFITCTESFEKFCKKVEIVFHHRPAVKGVVPGITETLDELRLRTLTFTHKYFGHIPLNFKGQTAWCCALRPAPRPEPEPEPEPTPIEVEE